MFKYILSIAVSMVLFTEVQADLKWSAERVRRQDEIKKHYAKYPVEAESLLTGANGQGQVPMVIFRLFNDLFPEIWGAPGEDYAPVGLTKNIFRPASKLPLGMGMSQALDATVSLSGKSVKLNVVGFNCLACHAGQVTDQRGNLKVFVGAPNTRINNALFTVAKTTNHPNFTAEKIKAALAKKPMGWIYGSGALFETERAERELIMEPGVAEAIVAKMKEAGKKLLGGVDAAIRPIMYAGPLSPEIFGTKRGNMDSLIPTYLAFLSTLKPPLDPTILLASIPNSASENDAPSIWNQKDKNINHWDGALGAPMHRNVGAASASLNKPVNLENVAQITKFIHQLPSDPYPFDVNSEMANRGKSLFEQNCKSCHSGQTKVYDYLNVGTDPSRYKHLSANGATFLSGLLGVLCSNPKLCSKSGGTAYAPTEIVVPTIGYQADRLDGIWARAPYLHNGSVPNLRALLTNKRPKFFERGNTQYDQKNVGFVSDRKSAGSVVYDTSLIGNSNVGHDTAQYLGRDWNQSPRELEDLLEYLKTL